MVLETDLARFNERWNVGDGCWIWASTMGNGYGLFKWGGVSHYRPAHRFAYEAFIGPVPEGRQVVHTCENRDCVYPGHLTALTRSEIVQASWSKRRRRAEITTAFAYELAAQRIGSGTS